MTELTNNERIILLGKALYGPWWKMETGRLCGVARYTIQRWVRGDYEPPDDAVVKVLRGAKQRRDEIDKAIKRATLYPWIT